MIAAHENPFRPERTDALAPLLDESLEDLLTRFAAQDHRGVLVGPHGSGKSTLLRAMAPRLGCITWLRLRQDPTHNRAALAELPGRIDGVLVLDGLEQLGPLGWWRIRRRARRILATSHRPGRLPTLRRQQTSAELLGRVIDALGEPRPDDIAELFAQHHGDVRACLRAMYDRLAAQ